MGNILVAGEAGRLVEPQPFECSAVNAGGLGHLTMRSELEAGTVEMADGADGDFTDVIRKTGFVADCCAERLLVVAVELGAFFSAGGLNSSWPRRAAPNGL